MSIAVADFLIGVVILFVLEALLFAASPGWMRRAMKSALANPAHSRLVRQRSPSGPILIWAAGCIICCIKKLRLSRHRGLRRTAFAV